MAPARAEEGGARRLDASLRELRFGWIRGWIPQTPEEHFARAAEYEGKAKKYRQEAALHERMLEDERKALPPKLKSGPEPGWVAKMRRHRDGYIQKAQALAQEADHFAEYHRMRGKEMQGQ